MSTAGRFRAQRRNATTSVRRPRLVVIGNGMAPGRALDRLFAIAPSLYDVTIFNAEPRVNYDRIMLSPVLSGEKSFEEIVIHGDGWYIEHGVTLHKGTTITDIDRANKIVRSATGMVTPYDQLIIATGSQPIILPVPGATLAGVITYRDLDDVQAMLLAAQARGRAVVIGGGLLGLEAAAGLKDRGMDVTVLHLCPTLMERQLDTVAGQLLRHEFETRGITVITGANTKAILGNKRVEAVELADGQRLPAELVIMAVGIRPNAQLARDSGLTVKRGIVIDDYMRTSDPAISAVGECVEVDGQVFGLVAPLYEMANVLAERLAGHVKPGFRPRCVATKLKVSRIHLFSAGDFGDGDNRDNVIARDLASGIYRRLVLRDGRIIGMVLYGDTSDASWLFDQMIAGTDTSAWRETLIFGRNFCPGAIPVVQSRTAVPGQPLQPAAIESAA